MNPNYPPWNEQLSRLKMNAWKTDCFPFEFAASHGANMTPWIFGYSILETHMLRLYFFQPPFANLKLLRFSNGKWHPWESSNFGFQPLTVPLANGIGSITDFFQTEILGNFGVVPEICTTTYLLYIWVTYRASRASTIFSPPTPHRHFLRIAPLRTCLCQWRCRGDLIASPWVRGDGWRWASQVTCEGMMLQGGPKNDPYNWGEMTPH